MVGSLDPLKPLPVAINNSRLQLYHTHLYTTLRQVADIFNTFSDIRNYCQDLIAIKLSIATRKWKSILICLFSLCRRVIIRKHHSFPFLPLAENVPIALFPLENSLTKGITSIQARYKGFLHIFLTRLHCFCHL